ncbi:TetR/AcrR family transcriptional regulator [Amycolatopsis circi]|uniref:TetR/AcrR family transcriptional regulator n=1 Tax=Amycolatopsis circi TaxID=871959 RepID=UPI0013BE92BB|nr:TetR/AcrR family transcriptional regulator [Amycolatopsis circi]
MRADAARNRAAILTSARTLLIARGPEAGMDEIAAEAGVAVGTLYRHFPTKQDLVREIAEDLGTVIAEMLDSATARVVAGETTAVDELLDLIRRVVVDLGEARLLRAALSNLSPEPLRAMREHAAKAIESLIATAQHDRALRPGISADDVGLLLATSPGADVPEPARRRWAELAWLALSDHRR